MFVRKLNLTRSGFMFRKLPRTCEKSRGLLCVPTLYVTSTKIKIKSVHVVMKKLIN